MIWLPKKAEAQFEVSAGVIAVKELSPGGASSSLRLGPSAAVSASFAQLGVPLLLEVGVARTDFEDFERAYHNDHLFIATHAQWEVVKGSTGLALRLGLGLYGEFQTVETDPPMAGGDNLYEMIVPGIALTQAIGSDTRLVLGLSDTVISPLNLVFDPEEASIEHKFRVLAGVQF